MHMLINRQHQIPGGFRFYQPETQWRSQPFASFNSIVQALIQHRQGNPALTAKYGWPTDAGSVANEVDKYNALICAQMGWTKFIQSGGGAAPVPKATPLSPIALKQIAAAADKVRKIWAGVKTLNDWLDSGEPAVGVVQSEHRAEICSTCPKNTAGDLTAWFTIPAADTIKRQMGVLQDRQLSTTLDDKLNVCEVCLCPLKLKVHTPFKFIKTPPDVMAQLRLVPNCWIPAEADAQ